LATWLIDVSTTCDAAVQASITAAGYADNTTFVPITASVVSRQAHANGDYVDAANGSTSLIANAASVGPAETFDLLSNPDGSVSLRAHSDNDYVTADNAGASPLIANRAAIGQWEEFDLIYD
jgi:non-reducing end alpha-L-arabinofuranosidase